MDNKKIFVNRMARHRSKTNECIVRELFNDINKDLKELQLETSINKDIKLEYYRQKFADIFCNSSKLEYEILNMLKQDEMVIKELIKNKQDKHCFQIMVDYDNGDSYTYEAEEFEKIRKVDDEYVLLLNGAVDTNELYEDDNTIYGNADFKYNYDTLAEIQLRRNDAIKEITMLDGNTGHEYIINFDLINDYFIQHSKNDEELKNINIIEILGNDFKAESIDN